MPFVTSRQTAARRVARRRPRNLAEMQAAQTQYQQDVLGAQAGLTQAQQQKTEQYSALSRQYEQQLGQYQSSLDAYNQRAADYSSRVDQYINVLNEIERARGQNITASLFNSSFLGSVFGEIPYADVPATPADPGSFTERFTMAAPSAPKAPSFERDISKFKTESEQARVRMEREVGERRAGTMRARRRMTDRPMLSGE